MVGITALACILLFIIILLGIYARMLVVYKANKANKEGKDGKDGKVKPYLQSESESESNSKPDAKAKLDSKGKAKAKPEPTSASGTYMGCFKDDKKRHLEFGHMSSKKMTHELCINHCTGSGFKYAGLQEGHCFCGNPGARGMGTKLEDKKCNKKCKGNKNQTCGAGYTSSIFATGK
jgi:hypothetical protein